MRLGLGLGFDMLLESSWMIMAIFFFFFVSISEMAAATWGG